MSPQPRRDTAAGRVYNDLRNLARREGRATDELFQLYLLERFLYRFARGPSSAQLVLKGGTLLAAYHLRRATQDIDVQARGMGNGLDTVAGWVGELCRVEVDDGVTFDLGGLAIDHIREGATYQGVRARVPASLGPAQLLLRLDISFGDPTTPAPAALSYPQLLGGSFEVLGYPLATVLAEKLVTMLELAEANTRDRDVALQPLSAALGGDLAGRRQTHRGRAGGRVPGWSRSSPWTSAPRWLRSPRSPTRR